MASTHEQAGARASIETAKGSFAGSLARVCAWQATHQGAFASIACDLGGRIVEIDVDDIDFDPDDVGSAIDEVARRAADALD